MLYVWKSCVSLSYSKQLKQSKMETTKQLVQINTLTPLAIHEKITLKGSDFLYPLGHKNRTVRKDRMSGYSFRALIILNKFYLKRNGAGS